MVFCTVIQIFCTNKNFCLCRLSKMFKPSKPTQNSRVHWFTPSDHVTTKGFLTDSQIVGENSKLQVIRNLQEWTPENSEKFPDTNLYDDSEAGWSPEDMFKTNEQNFGIRSTYKSTLKYTTEYTSSPKSLKREFEEWQGDRSG